MNAAEFLEARRGLGMTQLQLAAALGLTVRTVKAYEAGAWSDGSRAPVPRVVALALEALSVRARSA